MAKRKEEKELSVIPTNVIPKRLVSSLADEVARMVVSRLPSVLNRSKKRKTNGDKKKLEGALFLDTSAIIDGRIFEVIKLGLLSDIFVVISGVLLELKHIADSQDTVKRERGRKGLEYLEDLKKKRGVVVKILSDEQDGVLDDGKQREVDEKLIRMAKIYKGKILTCDYNLEKKATIQGVVAVNINALANCLKVKAVPGEALHIKILHIGKDLTQGVGYLDDGTMIVVEQASSDITETIDVVVSRVIQTSAGRILFAKKI